jgi:hypothetical protein
MSGTRKKLLCGDGARGIFGSLLRRWQDKSGRILAQAWSRTKGSRKMATKEKEARS